MPGLLGRAFGRGTNPASEQAAPAIKNRLLNEIDGGNARNEMPGWKGQKGMGFAYIDEYERNLEPGSLLLIPREGWLEDYRDYPKKTYGGEPPAGHP